MLAPLAQLRQCGSVPVLALLVFALMVFALIDAITRRDDQVKHLPKFAWVIFIILLPLIGSILWFTIGREYSAPREPMSFGDPRRWSSERAAPAPARDTRSTEEQLAALEREMEIAALEEQIRRRKTADDERSSAD